MTKAFKTIPRTKWIINEILMTLIIRMTVADINSQEIIIFKITVINP